MVCIQSALNPLFSQRKEFPRSVNRLRIAPLFASRYNLGVGLVKFRSLNYSY